MLLETPSTFQTGDGGLTITAVAVTGAAHGVARLHLAGAVDLAGSTVLSQTVDWLNAVAPVGVLVDLAAVTFAGAALPNFVARVAHALPGDTELILCRAGPATVRVLRLTDMAAIATIRDHPVDVDKRA